MIVDIVDLTADLLEIFEGADYASSNFAPVNSGRPDSDCRYIANI